MVESFEKWIGILAHLYMLDCDFKAKKLSYSARSYLAVLVRSW